MQQALAIGGHILVQHNLVLGASAVGIAVAELLADRGESVRLVTRTGSGPVHPRIERVAADATDADRLTWLTQGARAFYNCASPPYHLWPSEWPPLGAAILSAVERTGTVLASYSNLYGYGPHSGVMSEESPLAARHPKLRVRADMWQEALLLHEAGRIRMTEIRASDHIQPNSMVSLAMFKPMLKGKRVISPIPVDVPRTWTSVRDSARMLATVATDERAWGKAWHVPSGKARTARDLLQEFAQVNALPPPRIIVAPWPMIWTVGIFATLVREIRTTRYQFTHPFIMDSSRASTTFGLQHELLEIALRHAAQMLRG